MLKRFTMQKDYSQVIVLDTNIILNSADSILELSEKSKNLIIIPETVLDELDTKKSGFEEINFQARKFGRMLDDSELIDIDRRGGLTSTLLNINHGNNVDVLVVSKERYLITEDEEPKLKNDRKIIEIAQDMKSIYGNKLIFLTQDVMCRLRALSLGLPSEAYNITSDDDVILFNSFVINNDFELKDSYSVEEIINEFCVHPFGLQLSKNGKTNFYFRVSNMYQMVNEHDLLRQNVKPKNVNQKILNSLMLEPSYDAIICNAPAGCILPGTDIEIEVQEKWLSDNEINKIFNFNNNELKKLRKRGINYRKINNKTFEYELSSFRKYILRTLELNSHSIKIYNNDIKFNSKYLKLRYWLNTNYSIEECLNKVKFLRKNTKYFDYNENELINNNFNINNLDETILKIQSSLLTLQNNSSVFGNIMSIISTDFWTFRGYTLEESKLKVSKIQKENSNKKTQKYTKEELKHFTPRCIEYWIDKGYTKHESKNKVSEIQTTFSLDICIEKHGKEKGTQIWNKRQSKWQDTLKSKPQDEIDRINKSKVTYIIPINQMKDKDIYYMLVNRITKKQNIELLKDYDKRSKYGYHLDHIISKAYGFKHNIPPYIIGDISNLQMLLTNENTSKKSKCYSVIEQCSHIKDL